MELSTLLFLIVGVPLILVALGFFLLCLRWLRSKDQRAEQAKLLEAAAKLNITLANLEARLSSLEDILLPPGHYSQSNQPNQQNLTAQEFDRKLAGN
jgi:hypothetical protein